MTRISSTKHGSLVPSRVIGIQFSVYELMKRILLQTDKEPSSALSSISSGSSTTMKMYQTITRNKQGLLKKEVW